MKYMLTTGEKKVEEALFPGDKELPYLTWFVHADIFIIEK